ncbi:MAG: glycosyltransferase family 1 protein [Chlamydiales bacterium]
MPHLCIDARLYHGSGIGTHIKALLFSLSQFRLTLLVNEPLNLPFHQVMMKSGIYSLGEQIELPQKIPCCDTFWSPHFNIPLSPIRAKKRIVTVHDVFHLAYFSTLSLSKKFYAKIFLNAALYLSDYVMTDSQFSAQEIERYCFFQPKHLGIVPSCPLLHPHGRKMQGLPKRYILYVGNLKAHKNLARLFAAHAQMENPLPLVIVGKQFGEIHIPEHVYYMGYVPDDMLSEVYSGADLFVFPSIYEGFGIPPLEAMVCGCPVLVSRIASLPEVCGDAAEYIDPFSVSSIKKGMEFLLNHPERRKELVEKGWKRVKEFTIEKTAEKFINILDQVHEGTRK